MIAFEISTPGKVILHGEHAVVYGRTALAAGINLRTHLRFSECNSKERRIHISLPEILLKLEISFDEFLKHFESYENNSQLLDQVKQFITLKKGFFGNYSGIEQQQSSLQVVLYMLLYIAQKEKLQIKPFTINVTTELPLGEGLGSSASFAVCLAACFLHWAHQQKGDCDTFDYLEQISNYALNCEKIIHGSPSGIDNSVCTYGSLIEFRKGEPMKVLPNMPKLKILLVGTKQSRNTKDMINRVIEMKHLYPAVVDSIFDSIDGVSKAALQALNDIHEVHLTDEDLLKSRYKNYFTLINTNQALLTALNVSHPKLDTICTMAQNNGFAGKLTGAGGGGFAYIVLLPTVKHEQILHFIESLEKQAFSVKQTTLTCAGVSFEPNIAQKPRQSEEAETKP